MSHQANEIKEQEGPAVDNDTAGLRERETERDAEREKRTERERGTETETETESQSEEERERERDTSYQTNEIEELEGREVQNPPVRFYYVPPLRRPEENWSRWEQFYYEQNAPPRYSFNEAAPVDANAGSRDGEITGCLARVRRGLWETAQRFPAGTSSPTIFLFPGSLRNINHWAQVPEIISIGPYYRGEPHLCGFEQYKWFFLQKLLRRSVSNEERLIEFLACTQNSVRNNYSITVSMTTDEFLEMMLLDCCFLLELIHTFKSDNAIEERDPIFTQPWIIPTVIRDLLKLENQVPFSILMELDIMTRGIRAEVGDCLCSQALKVIDQAYPRSVASKQNFIAHPHHLLHLFYSTLVPTNWNECNNPTNGQKNYQPSDQSVQCVTKLRSSGIKLKSVQTENFLDISFRKRVLEIPSITINDFTTTMLINCAALEQCQESSSKYITEYISFMYCLINQPKDVSLLCSHGIIKRSSYGDHYVANLFEKLGKSTVCNVRGCYLSKQVKELELYYNCNRAEIRRTYCSSPLKVISIMSAFLIIALTIIQTVYAVLGHHSR